MDSKEFKQLLDEGQIGELLSEGGHNLTKEQLNLVIEKSKELSADALLQKKMQLANQQLDMVICFRRQKCQVTMLLLKAKEFI